MNNEALTHDAWAWWQGRRLGYNIAMCGAALAVYCLWMGAHQVFQQPLDGRLATVLTLGLGGLFVLVLGAANLLYLLGPLLEVWIRPADLAGFRRAAFSMGLTGSVALLLTYNLLDLAMIVARLPPSVSPPT